MVGITYSHRDDRVVSIMVWFNCYIYVHYEFKNNLNLKSTVFA